MLLTHSGYFAYDTVVCIYYNLYDSWLIFHHITTLLTLITSIFQGVSGTLIMGLIYSIYILPVGLVYIEAPNLPMHFRIILRKTGKRHTKIYETLELSYFCNISYFILFSYFYSPQRYFCACNFNSYMEGYQYSHNDQVYW